MQLRPVLDPLSGTRPLPGVTTPEDALLGHLPYAVSLIVVRPSPRTLARRAQIRARLKQLPARSQEIDNTSGSYRAPTTHGATSISGPTLVARKPDPPYLQEPSPSKRCGAPEYEHRLRALSRGRDAQANQRPNNSLHADLRGAPVSARHPVGGCSTSTPAPKRKRPSAPSRDRRL